MNILDTFYFVFESDVSKVKKGTEEGEASVKKLKKAVDDVDLSADKLAENFVNMAKSAASALAGVFALGAIKTLVNDTAAHTAAVALEARAMNMSVEAMSAYQASIVTMGGTANQATETLRKLRDGFIEVARFGTMGVSPMTIAFQTLGASAQTMRDAIKDPTIALSAIADNFAKLNRTQQIFLGQKLGLDQGTIMLLAQGRRAFDEMIAKQRELHAVTKEQADASLKYTIAQKELGMSFEAVKREIAMDLLPAFTWVVQHLDRMVSWLTEHKAVMMGVFTAIGTVVAVALVPPLVTAAGALWALIAPVLLAAAPFVALGLAIGLVVDDIEKFRNGQRSLIGEILERWPMIGRIARSVGEIVKMSWDLISRAIQWAAHILIDKGVAAWNQYKDALHPVVQLFEKLWHWISKFASAPAKVLDWIGNGLSRLTGEHYDNASGSPEQPRPTGASVAQLGNTASGRQIADKLVGMGWTPEQAAGIAGSFMQESGGSATALNQSSGAYGLGQWLGSRRKDFETWAGHPLERSSLDEQLRFFQYEVTNGKEQAAGRRLRAATTAAEAADIHSKYYERPGAFEANLARREMFANQIYAARSQIATASSSALAQPGATTTNVGGARSVQVTVGDVHVHSAHDPQATAKAVKEELARHINNAIDQHDDGIAG